MIQCVADAAGDRADLVDWNKVRASDAPSSDGDVAAAQAGVDALK